VGAPDHKTAKAYDPSRSDITFLTATNNFEPLFSRLSLLNVFNSLSIRWGITSVSVSELKIIPSSSNLFFKSWKFSIIPF